MSEHREPGESEPGESLPDAEAQPQNGPPTSGTPWRTWALIAASLIVAGVAIWWAANGASEEPAPVTPSTAAASVCEGLANEQVELNQQVVQPRSRFCFEILDPSDVTVGAAALDADEHITLRVTDRHGTLLGEAASEPTWDPQVFVTVEPGLYVGEVTGADGGAPGPFLIYTATFAVAGGAGQDEAPVDTAMPRLDACGGQVPLVADGAAAALDGESLADFACFAIDEPAFVKVGLISAATADPADLRLSLHRFDDAGVPTFMATTDDAFGLDPELSIDLEPGTYLVEAHAWFGARLGDATLYLDTDGDYWRRSEPSVRAALLEPDACLGDSVPNLAVGDQASVGDGHAVVCLDIGTPGRYTLQAASLDGLDIAMEVVEFDAEGVPWRLAWTDTDRYASDPSETSPLLDVRLPSGTLVAVITSAFAADGPGDFDIRLIAAETP